MSATANAKQDVEHLLTQLSDAATLEDNQYHVHVLEKVQQGRADIAAGRVYTTEEARQRVNASDWQRGPMPVLPSPT